ncbi:DUF1189 family protein [Clostridium sp. 'deep sea']|uniref:DUF1189 family protein n=1 Tax=Clostridium sp. 'deep sea' TaxID=2779445 RepID=UPI00189665E9|nr:DUF1189 family protein [Clostridium sp. 'deep sea']QOR36530.1 DUF1189 family protein [Clostridium sp. 'deep sea']
MEIRKMSFIKRLKAAVANFNFANIIIKERTRTAVKYFAILAFCISLVIGVTSYLVLKPVFVSIATQLENEVPDFNITNGILTVDGPQPYYNDDSETLLVVDSTGNLKIEDLKAQTTTKDILFFSKDKVYYYSPKNSSLKQEFSYSLLKVDFSKQSILNALQTHNIAFFLALYVSVVAFVAKFIGTILAWILALATASIKRVKLTGGQKYSLALYALTIPSLFNVMFNLSRFRFFYYLIIVIYLAKYMDAIKRDKNKNTHINNDSFSINNQI